MTLLRTGGLIGLGAEARVAEEHEVRLRFPRFFPAVPIEAYLQRPVFHPNVDPANGFVCLWDRFSPGDTVVQAVLLLQRILTWNVLNLNAEHLMQPHAAQWYQAGAPGHRLPLGYLEVRGDVGLDPAMIFPLRRRKVRSHLAD